MQGEQVLDMASPITRSRFPQSGAVDWQTADHNSVEPTAQVGEAAFSQDVSLMRRAFHRMAVLLLERRDKISLSGLICRLYERQTDA